MTAQELFSYFFDQADWIPDRAHCADAIRFGDPGKEITRIATMWSPCAANLEAAGRDGCDLAICHELPTSWERGEQSAKTQPWYQKRMEVCEKYGMTLFNLHDTWDHFPVYGVRDSFARMLELGECAKEMDYLHPHMDHVTTGRRSIGLYPVKEQTADSFAAHMARCLAKIGACGVQLMGDPEKTVRTVAIGVGCHVPSMDAFLAGADLLVEVYDRALQLQTRIPMAESGAAVAVIEHGAAEMFSMSEMARLLRERFGLPAQFYCNEPQGRLYVSEHRQK